MTKSITETSGNGKQNVMSKSMHCNLENGRQETAEAKKSEKPIVKPKSRNIPKAAPRVRPPGDNPKAVSKTSTSDIVQHSEGTGCFSYNCDTLSGRYDNNNDLLAMKIYVYTHKKWKNFFRKKRFPRFSNFRKKVS